MISRTGTFGYYAVLVIAYYLMIFVVAGIITLPFSLLVVITGGGCLAFAGVAGQIAVVYLIVLGLLGYWIYYLPTPLDSEVAFPETEHK